jgi:Holliday junction resolvasome RuvABC ATP-dependent DNA helicase subunit
MRFIGQHHIMRLLAIILPELYANPNKGAALLLDGPSGYGKTTMALSICDYLTANHRFEYYLYDRKPFVFAKRVIFIDEVHRMKDPEILYSVLDNKEHVFILATNHTGNLPEALRNRCEELIFVEYDDEELALIAMEASTFSTPVENYLKIADASGRNPRIMKRLVDNLGLYFRQHPEIDSNTADFDEILKEVFQIENGLDTLARRYLEVLENIGGTASLSLLSNVLHIDSDTIRNQIEPALLNKGLVQIKSKGRILI